MIRRRPATQRRMLAPMTSTDKETTGRDQMSISRRHVLLGGAGAMSAASFKFATPAIAQSEPIRIGWLAAMTGPSSAPTTGFNRGVIFAGDAINAPGGATGRQIGG